MKTVYDKTNSILNIYQDIQNQQQHTNQLLNEMKQVVASQMSNEDDRLQHLLMNHLGKIILSAFGIIFIPTCTYIWNLNKTITILEKNYEKLEIEIIKNDSEHKAFINKIDEHIQNYVIQDKKVYGIEQIVIDLKEKVKNIEQDIKQEMNNKTNK